MQPLLSWVKHPKGLRLSKEDEKNRAALGNVPVMRDGLLTGFRCGRRRCIENHQLLEPPSAWFSDEKKHH